jgi:tetratricopeptide (TPR) repeat protein
MDKEEIQKIQLAIHDLINQEKYDEALPLIYSVLEEHPNDAATLNFLGYIWLMGDKPAFAYQFFRRALQEMPGNKAIWTSLGRAAHELNMYEDALKYFLKSAELDPTYALAYSNAAATLVQTSKWDDAEKACKMALECNPNDLHGQLNLSHAYLAKGEWEKGWEYWGKSLGGKFRKEWVYGDEVRWDGSPDKTLVIYGEQGLGDEIFYGSCINDAIEISKKVYIDCDPRLETLFKRSFPKAEVHGTRKQDNVEWANGISFDARCAIGGLPEFCRKQSKSFPGTPFLVPNDDQVNMWKSMFKTWGKTVIGITTKGGISYTNAKGRILTEDDLKPLLKRKDIQLVSLDYNVERKIDGVKYFEFATNAKDYDVTASLIAACDMVLGVNTTALHCSAAMGVKTWCLVPKWHQWRYAQPSMPWYRHMRLIYQDDKTWNEVIENVVTQL